MSQNPPDLHGAAIIVNITLISLHGVITLLEMLLWGAVTALYHAVAEQKTVLIPPTQISFPGSCTQA